MKILIADDFAPIRRSLRRMLEPIPGVTEILEAANGIEVLDVFSRNDPSIIVLDILMPFKSGLDVLYETNGQLNGKTIIVLTNFASSALRNDCLRQGAHHVLDKSMEFSHIVDIVKAITESK